jgi:hypothetical protein
VALGRGALVRARRQGARRGATEAVVEFHSPPGCCSTRRAGHRRDATSSGSGSASATASRSRCRPRRPGPTSTARRSTSPSTSPPRSASARGLRAAARRRDRRLARAASPARTWSSRPGASCSRRSTNPVTGAPVLPRHVGPRRGRRHPAQRRSLVRPQPLLIAPGVRPLVQCCGEPCGSPSRWRRRRSRSCARRDSTSCDRCCRSTAPGSFATPTASRSPWSSRRSRSASSAKRSRRSPGDSGRSSPAPGSPRSSERWHCCGRSTSATSPSARSTPRPR